MTTDESIVLLALAWVAGLIPGMIIGAVLFGRKQASTHRRPD